MKMTYIKNNFRIRLYRLIKTPLGNPNVLSIHLNYWLNEFFSEN